MMIVLAFSSAAEEFRVENRVFLAGEKKPVSVSLTLFHQAVVYDFLQNPAETTVYDPAAGRFRLLQKNRRLRTEITTKEIASFVEQMRQRAAKHSDPAVRFYADPQFEKSFDRQRGQWELSSPEMTYRILVKNADSPAQATAYREFADASARLNYLLDPRARPPFARLIVNQTLGSRQLLPHEVTLTITTRKGNDPQPTTFRSEHRFSGTLTDSDRKRIAQAQEELTQFRAVGFAEYRKANSGK